jgi:dCMP deaminase
MTGVCPLCRWVGGHAPDCLNGGLKFGGGPVEDPLTAAAMGYKPVDVIREPVNTRQRLRDNVWGVVCGAVSVLSTCPKRRVGCVLLDAHGQVLSTGYNGVARGRPHCLDKPCPGVSAPSGQSLYSCEAVHAEANALIQCKDHLAIHTIYCTDSPCHICVNLLLNTSGVRLVFAREYPHPYSRTLWETAGREWLHTGDTVS